MLRAVGYCRFSSDMQREESIDAQERAIRQFVEKNNYSLIRTYVDRAMSATTDKRVEFQRMIDDARLGTFDVILVHKLDRFARNRADSAIYRKELEKYGVKLISVTENFDDSPESIILQSVIEGYNEYYSKNLRREVMKGLRENALTCRHTGGTPPLGYDVDKTTMKLVINEHEAESVKMIFKMVIDGEGYEAIINELNRRGYRTKRGTPFKRNSLYEILRNEKYTGVFVYNKSASKNAEGKFNRHKSKSDEDIIRVPGGVPQIISEEDFQKVQQKMAARRLKTATFKAKQEYLLSGKIVCGECGCAYCGNSRKAYSNHAMYISYRCTRRNNEVKCKNPEIQRDIIENIVLEKLADSLFCDSMFSAVMEQYNRYAMSQNTDLTRARETTERELADINKGINNIVNIMMKTGSAALSEKLQELETRREQLQASLSEIESKISNMSIDEAQLRQAFYKAKDMLRNGTVKNKKAIIAQYVNKVIIYRDKISIEFNISPTNHNDFRIKKDILR